MKIEFSGTMAWGAVSKGRLAFDVERTDALQQAVKKLHAAEQKKGPFELHLSMEVRLRGKTDLQLATYYALCRILSTEWNGGRVGPEMLDVDYVDEALKAQDWWPKVQTPKGPAPKLKRRMNTKELASCIDAIFDELSQMGVEVTDPAEIAVYWQKWRQHLNDEAVDYIDGEFTSASYKERIGSCEACGKYLRDGGGSLAHVSSKGMGGDPSEGQTFKASERMFLCDTHHAEYDNGQGRAAFLEKFPHLRRKIEDGIHKEVVKVATEIFTGDIRDDLF